MTQMSVFRSPAVQTKPSGGVMPTYSPNNLDQARPLATVRYIEGEAALATVQGAVHMAIPSAGNDMTEYWHALPRYSLSERTSGTRGAVVWAGDEENLFAACLIEDRPELASATRQAYYELTTFANEYGYGNIYRFWNYIGRVNANNAAGLERYRDFCLGRAQAFEDLHFAPTALPAGTGIGFREGGVAIFLVARRTTEAVNVENPMQTPAYQYPRRYGPKSPSFARATVIRTDCGAILYISGTASVRKHDSVGDDLSSQIRITVENIKELLHAARKRHPELHNGRFESMKIYVRNKADLELVARAFRSEFDVQISQSPTLLADICRSELLLEVEGIFRENRHELT
jgi:chorismate lyase/3-hydroxybenzoate synthase